MEPDRRADGAWERMAGTRRVAGAAMERPSTAGIVFYCLVIAFLCLAIRVLSRW